MYHHPGSGMTGGPPPPPPPGAGLMMGGQPPPPPPPQQQQQQQQQKHDIFVGNLAFSTTEEQLHQAFSEIGRLVKVRMVNDLETGKPRGFAFIEFEDPQAALSAIRNMNDYELNGRRIRVNFSNSSHLEALAGKLGMDLSQHSHSNNANNNNTNSSGDASGNASGGAGDGSNANASGGANAAKSGTNAISDALLGLSKGEMFDVISQLKQITEKDPDEARKILCGHPQLPEAILYFMSKLDMIKTPLENFMNHPAALAGIPPPKGIPPPPQPQLLQQPPPPSFAQPPPSRMSDPRGNLADPRAALSDPRAAARAAAADPRAALTRGDPRASSSATTTTASTTATTTTAATAPPPPQPPIGLGVGIVPPPHPPSMSIPPPPLGMMGHPPGVGVHPPPYNVNVPPPPPPNVPPGPPPPPASAGSADTALAAAMAAGSTAGMDSNLVKQVLSLTPQQIAQLPPDKQQSILALRQQITGGR